ncbi:hypothetical protein WJT74_03660 [Sphingomicrobium sp. XHP0239]|uniref:hypothetical protein n=1 Tax=Sphingomicrobium maritimum TaxID=3133972 RepID=UPI0031CC614E
MMGDVAGKHMSSSIGALVGANGESSEGRHALVSLGGQTLLDIQVRMLVAAGAAPIVVYSEGPHNAIAAQVERLRGEGLPVFLAEESADAATRFAAEDRLVLLGDGVLPDPRHLALLIEAPEDVILALPDEAASERFERIDLEWRWAGLALTRGERVRSTAAMAGDWDLVSTMLRRLVQSGAPIENAVGPEQDPPLLVSRRADIGPYEARQASAARAARRDVVTRFVLAPIERAIVDRLAGTGIPAWAGIALACLCYQAAFVAMLFDRRWIAVAAIVIGLLPSQLAVQLAARRMRTFGPVARQVTGWFAALVMLGLAVMGYDDIGWPIVPIAVAAGMFARIYDRETHRRPVTSNWRWLGVAWRVNMLVAVVALIVDRPADALSILMMQAAIAALLAQNRS